MKTALIFGITGQDGSYLAEYLLSLGYRVVGVSRRVSVPTDERIRHLRSNDKFLVVEGDVTDPFCVSSIINSCQPDEVFNLAAQSHVHTSFSQPHLTTDSTYIGCLNILASIRSLGYASKTRFYQASSSEMYGSSVSHRNEDRNSKEIFGYVTFPDDLVNKGARPVCFQDENTPMLPNSPYAIAKLAAHHLCRVYRDSYGIFACSGILFNHECLSAETPLLVKDTRGIFQIVTPDELMPLRKHGASSQGHVPAGWSVWDGGSWTPIKYITATKRRHGDNDHVVMSIETRAGVVDVTNHHRMLKEDYSEIQARQLVKGDSLATASALPHPTSISLLTKEMAAFLGYMVAEGHVAIDETHARFTNKDSSLLNCVADLWNRLFLGSVRYGHGVSGFTGEDIPYIELTGAGQHAYAILRDAMYHRTGKKRVPVQILNADIGLQKEFLEAYYAGDGLKAGNGDSIKTNSPLLALGILWIYSNHGKQCTVYKEQRGDKAYYQLNVLTGSLKGRHLLKPRSHVRRKVVSNRPTEWVFDIETDSNRLMAGVGTVIVHNSERRGEAFVTSKITKHVARWKKAELDTQVIDLVPRLKLGNLDAQRDWGHAEDYVRAMHAMLQQPAADDYVVATGESHTVREFLIEAFKAVGLDITNNLDAYVQIDRSLMRPSEVPMLRGDASKARTILGWSPKVSFADLARRMVYSDLSKLGVHNELETVPQPERPQQPVQFNKGTGFVPNRRGCSPARA